MNIDIKNIEYFRTDVTTLKLSPVWKEESGKAPQLVGHSFDIGDDRVALTRPRTKTSIFSSIGISPNAERLFTLEEVFNRAVDKGAIQRDITICVERTDSGYISHAASFKDDFIKIDQAINCIKSSDEEASITFCDGIIRSVHPARDAEASFSIGNLNFSGGFVVSVPIDGYGNPVTYLKVYIGKNSIVLEAKAFKSKIAMGSIGIQAVANNIKGYRNPEGFEAIQGQLELANDSWVSVAEALGLHSVLSKVKWIGDPNPLELMDKFNRTLGRWRGHLSEIVRNNVDDEEHAEEVIQTGLSSLVFIPEKERKNLPLDASVLDLFKFACDVRTNYNIDEYSKRAIDAYIGNLLSSRFDLAGQKKRIAEYSDFFV